MKVVYRISIVLNILFAGYILVRGGELLMKDYFFSAGEIALEQKGEPESTQVSAGGENITCDTIYTISEYDLSTGRQEIYQELLPAAIIGMNRQQLIEWLDDYNMSTPLEELEDGFLSMELLSFSPQEIRLRKRVESIEEPLPEPVDQPAQILQEKTIQTVSGNEGIYGCILAQEGLLTVYDGMRRHVILYTDISLFDLPENIQQEILEGKDVASEQELYNLLESYSS